MEKLQIRSKPIQSFTQLENACKGFLAGLKVYTLMPLCDEMQEMDLFLKENPIEIDQDQTITSAREYVESFIKAFESLKQHALQYLENPAVRKLFEEWFKGPGNYMRIVDCKLLMFEGYSLIKEQDLLSGLE